MGFSFVKNTEIRCCCGPMLLKMLKEGTSGVLNCSKSEKELWMGIFSNENAEIRYCWGFILLKMLK